MRLHFIHPRWKRLLDDYPELAEGLSGSQVAGFRMAGLGVPTAVGALPPGHEITVTDDNLADPPADPDADAVCISFFTPQATRAYELADRYRAQGVRVLGGGIHPSMAPDDTLKHFDAVVRGAVESVWPTLLEDVRRDTLRPVYEGDPGAAFAMPARDVFSDSSYLRSGIVQTARGCTRGCSFCVVPETYGRDLRFRPVDDVVRDVSALAFPTYYFADENLLFRDEANEGYTRDLLERLIAEGIRKPFFLAAYPDMLCDLDDAMARRFHRAGCRQVYLVLGLMDSLEKELGDSRLVDAMRRLKDLGIEAMTTFTLGNDEDGANPTPLIQAFCERTKTNLAEFTIYTPFPGTETFRRMRAEDRILTESWEKYNGANVVFRPRSMSADALQALFLDLWRLFYQGVNRYDMNKRFARGFGGDILRFSLSPGDGEAIRTDP